MLYNKKQISILTLTGQFSECMAESTWLAYVWQGKPNIWYVYVVLQKIDFQNLYPLECFEEGENTLLNVKTGESV